MEIRASGLAMSLHKLTGRLFWPLRRLLGHMGLSGTNIYICKKADSTVLHYDHDGASQESDAHVTRDADVPHLQHQPAAS